MSQLILIAPAAFKGTLGPRQVAGNPQVAVVASGGGVYAQAFLLTRD